MRVRSRHDPDHFDDEQATWRDEFGLVRLTRDREQWWCDLSVDGWDDGFCLDLVAGCSPRTRSQTRRSNARRGVDMPVILWDISGATSEAGSPA